MSQPAASARSRLALAAAVALLVASGGCGVFDPVEIEITFRDSLVGAGKIVQIENTSNEPVTDIEILITAPEGESRSFQLEQLGPFQTFEIGWKKLGGWQIPLGAEVKVKAAGHLLPLRARLPKEGDE